MWKLITIKPLATMRGFLPYLTSTLVELLRKYYENKYQQFNYKELVMSVINELSVGMSYELFKEWTEQLHVDIEKASVEDKICILDIFGQIAKHDTECKFIDQKLIYDLPSFIQNGGNEDLINSAAVLLSSL